MSHRREKRKGTIGGTTCQNGRDFFPCPPGSRVQAKKLLELAKHDLDASKVLREEQLFALSVFHMQQGFEKALKAEMYLTGQYSEKEIRGFGHDVLKASEDFKNKMSEHYGWGEGDLKRNELYNYVREGRDSVVRMDYDQIYRMLFAQFDEQSSYRARLRAGGLSELKIEASYAVIFEINALSVLLAFHEQSTRYIDARGSDLTPFDYDSELGIVKALPDIGWKLELIIGELEWLILRAISKDR